MKPSKYNFYFEDRTEGIFLIYNSLKNALIEVPDASHYQQLAASNGNFKQNLFPGDELEMLTRNGMIVSGDEDEAQQARGDWDQLWTTKKSVADEIISLTITPTLGCNFKCFYCYESSSVKNMETELSEEVQKGILTYIENGLKRGIKEVGITWYGGEPLLRTDIVISMQRKINELCDKYNIQRRKGSIVTNGLLLTKETSDMLVDLGITFAQVSIDGPEIIHNKRRYFPDSPKDNFKTLIHNILNANEKLTIPIRINIDNKNKNHVIELVDSLIENKVWPYRKNVYIDFAFVEAGIGCNDNSAGLSRMESLELEDRFRLYLVNKYNEIYQTDRAKLSFKYPMFRGKISRCGYGYGSNIWVVDYEGKLYKCWESVGMNTLSVGTVKDLLDDDGAAISAKLQQDESRFERWGCGDCKYMPICGFGCPWEYLSNFDTRKCGEWKHNLEYRILNQYKQYKNNPSLFSSTPFVNE